MSRMETDIPRKDLSTEDRLRAEVEDLKRQLEEQKRSQAKAPPASQPAQPSRMTLGALSEVGAVAIVVAFFAGYLPHRRREAMLDAEANATHEALPVVTVVPVVRSTGSLSLKLPGSIQAVTETPVLSRSNGYLGKRYADIGDRVTARQLLAEIEAPDLEQLLVQGRAELRQTRYALGQ